MRRIAPFKRGGTWWARVPRIGHPAVQRSLNVSDEAEAWEVCRFLEWLRGRGARSAYLLDGMALGKTTVLAAYSAYVQNRLDAFEGELRDGIADPDLEPYVAKWVKEMERRKRPNAHTRGKYLRQVRTLLPEGKPFPRSQFTRQRVRDWMSELTVGQPNRYRAALSSFAGFLLFEDVIQANVVRLVPMARESEPRTAHLTPEEAELLVNAMPEPHRTLHALMLATGMELGAALALRKGDVALGSAYARGTKREHRKRECTIYSRWTAFWARHVWPQVLDGKLPGALLFDGVTPWGTYRVMKAALSAPALKHLPQDYRVHDHRHTWAVQAVRDGLALNVVAHQLGHRDSVMTLRVYGKHRPTASDFSPKIMPTATSSATEAVS